MAANGVEAQLDVFAAPETKDDPDIVTAVAVSSEDVDGGWRGWIVVVGACFSNLCSVGLNNGIGTFQDYYRVNQLSGQSDSAIAWIGSLQGALMLCCGIVSGTLFDRGYFRYLLSTGAALLIIGVFLQSVCAEYYQFVLCQGVLQGLAMGIFFTSAYAAVWTWFKPGRQQALAVGVLSAFGGVGGIIWPISLDRLFVQVGYKKAVLIQGGMVTVFMLLALLLCRQNKLKAPKKRPLFDLTPLKDGVFSVYCGVGFVNSLAIFLPWFYIPTFVRTQTSFGSANADYLLAAFNGAAIIGRLVGAVAADRLGATNIFIFCCGGCVAILYSWYAAASNGGFIVWLIIGGAFVGAEFSGIPATLGSLSRFKRYESGNRGGIFFFFEGLAQLAGPPIAGALLGSNNDFKSVSLFGGSVLVATLIMIIFNRHLFARETGLKYF